MKLSAMATQYMSNLNNSGSMYKNSSSVGHYLDDYIINQQTVSATNATIQRYTYIITYESNILMVLIAPV